MFGMGMGETQTAAVVLKALGEEWRELVAGQEGFLTDEKRAGLRRQKVVWGEMDSMVCLLHVPTWSCLLASMAEGNESRLRRVVIVR